MSIKQEGVSTPVVDEVAHLERKPDEEPKNHLFAIQWERPGSGRKEIYEFESGRPCLASEYFESGKLKLPGNDIVTAGDANFACRLVHESWGNGLNKIAVVIEEGSVELFGKYIKGDEETARPENGHSGFLRFTVGITAKKLFEEKS